VKEGTYIPVDAVLKEEVDDLKLKTRLPHSQIGRTMSMSIIPNLKEP